MKQIVTIGREFGSGGRTIGKRLSERLGVPFYDKEILAEAANNSGLSAKVIETHDEKPINSFFYSLVTDSSGMGSFSTHVEMPLNQKVFLAQFEAIRSIAERESCVLVGRCADYALESMEHVTNVFICANLEDRVRRVAEKHNLSRDKAMDLIAKSDKKRANYYNFYSNKRWGVASTYHLCLNSSLIGEEGCVDMIFRFMDHELVKNHWS